MTAMDIVPERCAACVNIVIAMGAIACVVATVAVWLPFIAGKIS